MKNNKSLLDKYIRISVSHTLYVPSEDEFGIKDKLKEMEENKRLENIFEYPIWPESLSLLCRVLDDRDCDNLGYFEKSISNVGEDMFSVFQENGKYRPAKKGYKICDITILNNRGEEIVIIMPETNVEGAIIPIQRLRGLVEDYNLESISIGDEPNRRLKVIRRQK